MGDLAEYALDSLYWTEDGESMAIVPDDAEECWRPTVHALAAMKHLARPIRAALGRRG